MEKTLAKPLLEYAHGSHRVSWLMIQNEEERNERRVRRFGRDARYLKNIYYRVLLCKETRYNLARRDRYVLTLTCIIL
jgi:hypothetical protein